MKEYFIAFGGNLGQIEQNFIKAASLIEKLIGKIILKSSLYKSKALTLDGTQKQNEYLNCVISLETNKNEKEVLKILNSIETKLGRVRAEKWDSRVIDLDIVAVGDLVIETKELSIPHKEMHKRTFVLKPLAEIAPDWKHPKFIKTASELMLESNLASEMPCEILKSFPDYES